MSEQRLRELWASCRYRSLAAFRNYCHEHGFTNNKAIKEFHEAHSVTDIAKPITPAKLPIYSESPGAYQMDIIFDRHMRGQWLVFINVNTRKAYAYQIRSKETGPILQALRNFKREVGTVNVITSDQEAAFLSDEVCSWLRSQRIDYRTTFSHDHNKLGLINRFVRTLKTMNATVVDAQGNKALVSEDQAPPLTAQSVAELIREYNSHKHRGLKVIDGTPKSPNQITAADETL